MSSKRLIILALMLCFSIVNAADKPNLEAQKLNIIVLFADDISAREFPVYGSTVWTPPRDFGGTTKERQFRARTPVLDKLARDGAYATTCWATPVCSPSRATASSRVRSAGAMSSGIEALIFSSPLERCWR